MTIVEGKKVAVEYTLTLEGNEVFASNVGNPPLVYVHGSHEIVLGLERALEGLNVGDRKLVLVEPEEGYGNVIPEAFMEVKKDEVPRDALQVGARLYGKTGSGLEIRSQVSEIKEDTVTLDLNHPLAGKTLCYDVTILSVE